MNDRKNNIWEFEDISSSSLTERSRRPNTDYESRPQRRPQPQGSRPRSIDNRRPPQRPPVSQRPPQQRQIRPQRRPEPEWSVPEWELYERNRRPRAGPDDRPRSRRPEQRPQPRKRQKKPMSRGARKAFSTVIVLLMAGITVFLAVFLLFKISEIEVTGDIIDGLDSSTVIEICGYEIGDNLVLAPTADKEEQLKKQVPYIADVKISRHLPGTLEINLTAAQVAACMTNGSEWLYVSAEGKILEKQSAPKSGVMQIIGLQAATGEPGEYVIVEEDNAQLAYTTILSALADLGTGGDFTKLDLSDLSNITMLYQDRIEFKLGNVLELEYKISLGCRSVTELAAGEQGVMDLSGADETKRAVFTAGTVEPSASSQQPESTTPDDTNPDDDSDSDDGWSDDEDDTGSSQSGGRGDEIPDEIFTGNNDDDY